MTLALRHLRNEDAAAATTLYQTLSKDNAVADAGAFERLILHPGTSVTGAFDESVLTGMATLHILPNMTYGGRPYGLVENVVTQAARRGQGIGTLVLEHVINAAWQAGAYKIMLQTGRARGALRFYEGLGFSRAEKHGMILRRVPARTPV